MDTPELESKVTVLNINEGMSKQLKEKCSDLKEYIQYVNRGRKYSEEMLLHDAVVIAVDECIRENILRDFLMEQKVGVIKVSIYEFDEEREMRLIQEDEREIGREEGIEIGRAESLRRMMTFNKILLADNRIDDLRKATEDETYLVALCEEYSI